LLGGPATFARDNATLNINVYNNNNNNNNNNNIPRLHFMQRGKK